MRPVIGIAMLASPVLRTRPRDEWLGWTPQSFVDRLRTGRWNAKVALKALATRIDDSIDEIRWDDIATESEIAHPTERTIFRLEQQGAGAAAARRRQLEDDYEEAFDGQGRARSQVDPTKRGVDDINWEAASTDLLFVRKRSETLARLLAAKRAFNELNWRATGIRLLDELLATSVGERALSVALLEVRKAGLASQVADLSVCGAIPPYNVILGGKLVALAVVSSEVRQYWRERYENEVSIISSQMAGRPVSRRADLKVLTTTSLYGSGSSQYNRLKLRATEHSGLRTDLEWQLLDRTAGYGTVHLGTKTVRTLREVAETEFKARTVNNRFGEGASPRLRQIREGLDVLGIDSDEVLNHATPRLLYAFSLAKDADMQLLGLRKSTPTRSPSLAVIADAWRRRWLLNRVHQTSILERLAQLGPATVHNELLPIDTEAQYLLALE